MADPTGLLSSSPGDNMSSLAGRVLAVPAMSPSRRLRGSSSSPHPSLSGSIDDTDLAELRFPPPRPNPPSPRSRGQMSPLLSSTKMARHPDSNTSPPPSPLRRSSTTHHEVSRPASSSSSLLPSKQKLNLSELTYVDPSQSSSRMPPPPARRGSPAISSLPSLNTFEDNFVSSRAQQQVTADEQTAFRRVSYPGGMPTPPSRSRPFQPPISIGPPLPPPPQPSPLRQLPIRGSTMVAMPAFMSPLIARHSQRSGYGGIASMGSPFHSATSAFFPSLPSPLPPPPPLPQLDNSILTHRQCQSPNLRKPSPAPPGPRQQPSSSNDPDGTSSLRDSSPLYQPRTDEENEGKEKLNLTFTVSSSSPSSCATNKPTASKSHPEAPRLHTSNTTAAEVEGRREGKPLAQLQSNLSERKKPSYLALTKSAANKRVQSGGMRSVRDGEASNMWGMNSSLGELANAYVCPVGCTIMV